MDSRKVGLGILGFLALAVWSVYFYTKPKLYNYQKTLIVYSYPSFLNAWGPGPILVKEFEAQCDCKINLVQVEDSTLILQKLLREREKRVDLVLGLDQLHLPQAEEKLSWQPLSELVELLPDREVPAHHFFLPLDWAPLTFIYRKSELKNPPRSIDDLLKPEYKSTIALQDPRTSTPGLQFLSWISLVKKENAATFLKQLKHNIHSISPSWSTAYGLFKKKQAKLAYSYLTSPVYHWVEEKDSDYQPIVFKESLAVQYEWMAIPEGSSNVPLAKEFIKFLLSDSAQKIVMEKNYMFPAQERIMAQTPFAQLPLVKTFSLQDYATLKMKELLDLWSQVQ
ncbi:MAG: thiamine ABC transporter substrate-binding protein [Bdellovibrionales bacterium]